MGWAPSALLMDVQVADHPYAPLIEEQLSTCTDSITVDSTPGDASVYVAFEELPRWNRAAIDRGIPLVTIELGTVGGLPLADIAGAVMLCDPTGPCFACLETRVAATDEDRSAPAPPIDPPVGYVLAAIGGMYVRQHWSDERQPGTVTTLPFNAHEVLPVPGCAACETDADSRWLPGGAPDREPRSVTAAVAAGERAMDEHIGIIREVGEARSLPAPYFLARLAATTHMSDVQAPEQAAGVADEWDVAFMKGIGECLERYAAGIYDASTFHSGTVAAVAPRLDPETCVRPIDASPLTEPLPWVPGTQLSTDEDTWIPAELVVFPPPAQDIRPPITTGLSLGNTIEEALAGGLAEVIERDAAMLAWYSTFEPMELQVTTDQYERMVRRARFEDLELQLLLLTQDVDLPVVACLAIRDRWPQLAVGSAARLDASAAAIRAAEEALQNWMELDEMGETGAMETASRLARHATDPGDALDALAPAGSVNADQLSHEPIDDPMLRKQQLIELLTAAKLTPYAARTTTRDLERLGFEAVRVIIPTAQPLVLGDPYFGDRARSVPDALGYQATLNRSPHPFP